MICYCCTSQVITEKGSEKNKLKNLKPAFAGQFYPADKIALEQSLMQLFKDAEPKTVNHVLAIIAPHAGYVFSGTVAASAYNQIDPEKVYENIFVIASSHRKYFNGASIYSIGNCETPLGEVKVNLELAQKLIDEHKVFTFDLDAHTAEHSVEVQLPLLQYILKKDFSIIPIVIGSQSKEDCRLIAKALSPYFNENNLFVISSDFSHYPDFSNANRLDKLTANVILENDPQQFMNIIHSSENDKVPGLATLTCGWSSVLTLLYLTEDRQNIDYNFIAYANSGQSVYGDKERVVGYNAIAVSHKPEGLLSEQFNLSLEDKKMLLEIARTTIAEFLSSNKIKPLNSEDLPDNLKTNCGAFVTLNKNHRLRGCIGRFDATEPLYQVVQQMAVASATQDSRFTPVTKDEMQEIEVEISVLTPMTLIQSIGEIVLGKHGIYIKKGNRTGTFLPQVATETGWTLEEFLGHCSRDKAGLGWDGWKEAEIFIYEALVFSVSD
jgi:hypothetical protein